MQAMRVMLAVHPRLRGELGRPVSTVSNIGGSSPLTRGTQKNVSDVHETSRFIPAYAGNSLKSHTYHLPLTVHPRLRGELT